ncbi:hypothetical protein Tco_0275111 [Tanacetum coccineum]
MTSMPNCGALCDAVGEWDWEMINAYDKKVDFIRELKGVPGIAAAVKTGEFLNNNLWKYDKRIQKLRNMNADAAMKANEMENFAHKL